MPSTQDHLQSSNKISQYHSPGDLHKQIDIYVHNMRRLDLLPTIPGLVIFLGFNDSDYFYKWVDKNKRFRPCFLRARDLLHDAGLQRMTNKDNRNGNGCFRYMAKAFEYSEKIDVNNMGSVKVIRLPAKGKPGSSLKNLLDQQKKPSLKKKTKGKNNN